jgi:hypothetical protein
MTNDPREELDGLLGAAVRQLIDAPGGDQPPADLDDELLRQFSRSGEPTLKQNPARNKRFAMAMKYGLAASVLATVASAISVLGILAGQSTVYAHVAERVEQLNSLVCRVQWVGDKWPDRIDGELGQKVTYLAPSRYRIEDSAGGIHIIDTQDNKAIYLNSTSREALVIQGHAADAMVLSSPVPLVKALRDHFRTDRVIDEGVHELGEREIDGVPAIGLRSAMAGQVVEAWVDPTTHLPLEVRVRLVIPSHLAGGKKASMWRVMTAFEYDVEVDDALMAMKVPEGYTTISMPDIPVDRRQATLDDLMAMLRMCATHNDSLFPLTLKMDDDEGTCMAILKRYAGRLDGKIASGSEDERKAAVEAVTEFGAVLGRGTAFLYSITEENDLHYFAGARLNQPNRPLLWYSPHADANYKVVYADLSVKDASADSLPSEPVRPTAKERAKPATDAAMEPWSTPTLELPPHSVRDYASLQAVRTQGKQEAVQYLVLAWMPEFIELPAGVAPRQPQALPEDWRPDRSPDSARLEFLTEFPNLKGLKVDHLCLTQKDLDIIGQCTKLERLSLSGVQILEKSPRRLSGDDLQKLRDLTNLRELDLGQSQFVGGLHYLSELPHLRKLYLGSFEYLNDKSVAELQALPHLESLVLAPVYGTNPEKTVTDVGLLSLQKLPKLETLYVGWHGRWTMPVEKLRELLPKVQIKTGD